MFASPIQHGSQVNSRRGVTAIEFAGCLVALCGGVVIGSMYLGVDMKVMAKGILEQADIEVPEILSDPAEVKASASESSDSEEHVEEDSDTPAVTPGDVETAAVVEATAEENPARKELTDAERQAATQAYWTHLNRCVQEEVAHRSNSIESASWQLFDYLLHRKEGHQQAVEALEQIDQHGVDQRLLAHAEQVLTWHRMGTQLYDRAAHLLTDAPSGKLTGPFAQSWQSAATQHRMEEKLILNKHAAVASYLEHTYKSSAL